MTRKTVPLMTILDVIYCVAAGLQEILEKMFVSQTKEHVHHLQLSVCCFLLTFILCCDLPLCN